MYLIFLSHNAGACMFLSKTSADVLQFYVWTFRMFPFYFLFETTGLDIEMFMEFSLYMSKFLFHASTAISF